MNRVAPYQPPLVGSNTVKRAEKIRNRAEQMRARMSEIVKKGNKATPEEKKEYINLYVKFPEAAYELEQLQIPNLNGGKRKQTRKSMRKKKGTMKRRRN